MSKSYPLCLAAVIEYLAAEVIEISGKWAKDYKKKRITPREVMLAVYTDPELNSL